MAETINQPLSASQKNLVNPITGFLSKAADTALEVTLIREGAKADSKRSIGTVAPTGQIDPARVESVKVTASQEATPAEVKQDPKSQLPLIVGISAGTVLLLGVMYVATRKKGK